MKKHLSIALIAVLGLFAWSCSDDNIVAVYNPDSVNPQTLGDVTGVTLAPDGDPITITFTEVDFGLAVPVSYTLYVAKAGTDFDPMQKVAATVDTEKGTITVKQPDLNTALLNLGASSDADFQAEFRLVANALTDKNVAVETTSTASAVKAATFRVYEATLLDKDVYEIVYVQGDYAGWNFDNCQYLYNYSKDGHTYTGVVDLADKAANGIKVTGTNDWGDATGNWGFDDDSGEQTAEAGSLQLKNGSNTNVTAYSKRFYSFSFDKNSLVLTKQWSADVISIIGAFNGWADEGEIDMQYNPDYVRFYADVDFAEATEFKFRADHTWGDAEWGADAAMKGPNIPCEAGQYRIYLDLNKNEVKIDANMYGKDEPKAGKDDPEPQPQPTYQGWGIVGSINDWNGDVAMTEADGVWTGYVKLTAGDQWKLRKDAGWDENRGAEGDVEPYVVTLGESFKAVGGGKNLSVPADGFYKVVYNTADETITVSEGNVWGVIGQFNDWNGDVFMTPTDDALWHSPVLTLKANEGFKIRHNADWAENRGAEGDVEPFIVTIGTPLTAVQGGKNLAVEADGDYILTYDPIAETITVDAALPQNCWSLIGVIAGSNWDKDFYMTEKNGLWVSSPVELKAGDGFKIRFDNKWDVNRGATGDVEPFALGMGDVIEAVQNGKNLTVKEDGTYTVVYNATKEQIFFLGWAVIGEVNGTMWDTDFVMTPSEGNVWTSDIFKAEGGFKIRFGGGWDVNRGATGDVEPYVITSGVAIEAWPGGKNLGANAEEGSYYKVVYYADSDRLMVVNCSWSVIGEINGTMWDTDIEMQENEPGIVTSVPFAVEGGFKIRFNRDWPVNRGAEGDVEPYNVELGTPVTVVNNGKNLGVENASGTYVIRYEKANETITVTAGE